EAAILTVKNLCRWLSIWLFAMPGGAFAQAWATPEFCTAPLRPITSADFEPHDLGSLEAEAAAIPNGTGRLWRVEAPNGAISHLWGTFHVSTPAVLDLPATVKERIDAARAVAVEIDFTFPDRTSFLMQFDLPGRYRDPADPFAAQDELDLGFLPAAAEGWVYDRLYDYGTFDVALFVLTYGGLAELLLSDPCEDYASGTIPVQDDLIHTFGHIAGSQIIGLEEPGAFLTDLSDDIETAKAIIAVYASYLEPQTSPGARLAAFQLYIEGRLGVLAAWDEAHVRRVLGSAGAAALARTDRYLIERRNLRFLDRIAPELRQGAVFMAVGAAHLPGEKGLVAMLRDSGFTVTRRPLPGEVE
ncbi:MAG: TraB/GumN family protein, partial [Pseudomonadota bacterium]